MNTKTIKSAIALATTAGVMSFTANQGETTYTLQEKSSSLEWFAEKVTGKHNGTVLLKSGFLTLKDDQITKGEFVIDMTTINTTDLEGEYKEQLDGHLKSADFFDVQNHKTAKILIKKSSKNSDGTHKITADLSIKNITHEITFNAKVTNGPNSNLNALADITIDRTKWNIRYGSGSFFDNLGDKMIYDEIKFKVQVSALKKQA